MSESKPEPVVAEPPHAWVKLTAALSAFGFLSVIAVMMIRMYLDTRPVNLMGVTQRAANSLEAVLVANRVPRDGIDVRGPERNEHPAAHWYSYEFDVRLPASVSLEGIEAVIARRMSSESVNLRVEDFIDGGRKRGLSLNYGDIGFAVVRLHPTIAPESEVPTAAPSELAIDDGAAREDRVASVVPRFPESLWAIEPIDGREWRPVEKIWEAEGAPETAAPELAAPVPVEEAPARLAILLDDGGYGGPITEDVLGLPPELTLAILPYTPAATKTAERAAALGFEVMLHMPMENMDPGLYPHEGQLLVEMGEAEIRELTEKALAQVPHAVGINNHMGSRFTSDPAAMARFLSVASQWDLYFVDSRTAATTKAYSLAKTFGMRADERDIFLDHVDDADDIRRRFEQAVALAKAEGSAIAIGHFRVLTVAVLKELLPTLDPDVKLVHVSELIE